MRATFSQPPQWAGSGALKGSDLVLADSVGRSLLRYSAASGKAKADLPGPLSESWTDLHPIRVAAQPDGGLIVQADASQFFLFDSADRYERRFDISSRAQDGSVIDRIYTWALTGKSLVALADIQTRRGQGESWMTSLVRFPLDATASSSGFQTLPGSDLTPGHAPLDQSRKFHRLGFSYIAGREDNEEAYILLMEDSFRLFRTSKEQGKLTELPGALEPLFPSTKPAPALPTYVRPEDFPLVMREVEKVAMPVGLYSWKKDLYLLSRQPQGNSTQWLLSRIDLGRGRIVGTVLIPSRANHLFAVPGAEQWVFVEKGPALGLRDQKVRSTLSLSSRVLEAAFSRAVRLKGSQPSVDVCQ